MNVLLIFALFLAILMIIIALYAVLNKSVVVAVISAGVVSLIASVFYLLFAAPDVAMTEAAIGSGLSTIIFFYVLNRTRKGGEHE